VTDRQGGIHGTEKNVERETYSGISGGLDTCTLFKKNITELDEIIAARVTALEHLSVVRYLRILIDIMILHITIMVFMMNSA